MVTFNVMTKETDLWGRNKYSVFYGQDYSHEQRYYLINQSVETPSDIVTIFEDYYPVTFDVVTEIFEKGLFAKSGILVEEVINVVGIFRTYVSL